MTTDLWMLVWTTLLCLVMPMLYVFGELRAPGGVEWGLGNRETPFELPAWAARAKRAHLNLLENLLPFAALVLVANVSGKANAMTALGATIFFWSRLAYAIVYTAGIKVVRTIIFFIGSAGLLLILIQLF
jgi:uncharacterized MAPEG superfamily protein